MQVGPLALAPSTPIVLCAETRILVRRNREEHPS